MPVSVKLCGLSAALSVRVSVPFRCPAVEGEKLTLIVQAAPTASVAVHVLTSLKSPLVATALIVMGLLP